MCWCLEKVVKCWSLQINSALNFKNHIELYLMTGRIIIIYLNTMRTILITYQWAEADEWIGQVIWREVPRLWSWWAISCEWSGWVGQQQTGRSHTFLRILWQLTVEHAAKWAWGTLWYLCMRSWIVLHIICLLHTEHAITMYYIIIWGTFLHFLRLITIDGNYWSRWLKMHADKLRIVWFGK